MALWEYKIITSGKGGFASPSLLETYLNQLGKDEWEIIQFHAQPDNPLAFNGMARRPTQREWTLEAAVAAAAKAEADKLRAELIQKQHAGETTASAGQTEASESAEPVEKPLAAEGIRKVRDTERDNDPEALAAEEQGIAGGDWDDFDEFDDDLPTFFDAIKPHQRKNQKGPGSAVGVDFLAKRWEQTEDDITGALRECGFTIPDTEDDAPVYLEFEGDLYWINRNNRGTLYINTREKPRPVFRVVKARELAADDPAAAELAEEHAAEQAERKRRAEEQAARDAEAAARRAEQEARRQEEAERRAAEQAEREAKAAELAAQPLPQGPELLVAIEPFMRRNRRGPGNSGSVGFLAKTLHHPEEELLAGLAAAGLILPEQNGGKGEPAEIGDQVYWLNKDGRGGVWINAREKREPRPEAPESSESPAGAPAEPASSSSETAADSDQTENDAVIASPAASDEAEDADGPDASDASPDDASPDSSDPEQAGKPRKPRTNRTRSRRGPAKKKTAAKDAPPAPPEPPAGPAAE
ncbi:MAG: hypothetical protein ABII82_06245 [Verrucomicrobiota bacterium]